MYFYTHCFLIVSPPVENIVLHDTGSWRKKWLGTDDLEYTILTKKKLPFEIISGPPWLKIHNLVNPGSSYPQVPDMPAKVSVPALHYNPHRGQTLP